MFPPVQVGRSGTRTASTADLASLHETFARTQLLSLPAFFEPSLLQQLVTVIEEAPWKPRVHHTHNAWATGDDQPLPPSGDEWASDLHVEDVALNTSIAFLLNDRVLFRAVETITGCSSIASFFPNLYKLLPGSGHYDDWHTDDDGLRRAVLSVNVGHRAFHGGVLCVRNRRNGRVLHELQNTRVGDAMLLGIGPDLEHVVTPVTGDAPRVALAGWFTAAPSLFPGLPA